SPSRSIAPSRAESAPHPRHIGGRARPPVSSASYGRPSADPSYARHAARAARPTQQRLGGTSDRRQFNKLQVFALDRSCGGCAMVCPARRRATALPSGSTALTARPLVMVPSRRQSGATGLPVAVQYREGAKGAIEELADAAA